MAAQHLGICNAVNTFMSHSCHVQRFVEVLDIEMCPRSSKNLLVLIQLGSIKDLIDLLDCGVTKLL